LYRFEDITVYIIWWG